MKIKKILCSILTAAMVVSSVSVMDTKKVEASLEYRAEVGMTITAKGGAESVEVTEKDKLIKISVEETGVYNVALSSATDAPYYELYSQEAKYIGYLSLDYGDLEEDFRNFYFVKGRDYYFVCLDNKSLVYDDENYKCSLVFEKTDLNIEEEIEKSSVNMHAYYCVANGLPEGHNYYLNDNEINEKINGVNWDDKTNTLTFNNYTGPYIFDASYGLSVCCDSKDCNKPTLKIVFNGENNFTGMSVEKNRASTKTIFYIDDIDVSIEGTGTVNINPVNVVNDDASVIKESTLALSSIEQNLTIDGPVINVEKMVNSSELIWGSSVVFKSGKLNIKSLNAYEYYNISTLEARYPSIIYANSLILEGGNVFVKIEDYDSDNQLTDSTLFVGNDFLNVQKDFVMGINADDKLFVDDASRILWVFGCKCPETTDCFISDDAVLLTGKQVTMEMVENYKKEQNTKKDNISKKTEVKKSTENVGGSKVGTKISDKKFTYKVLKDGTKDGKNVGKVEIVALKNKKAKNVVINDVVTIDGVKYKVTSIGKKAFAKCKKLKKVTIKAKGIKSIKKGAFKGVKKSCKILVPKAKKKAYKKLLKKAKCKAKVK